MKRRPAKAAFPGIESAGDAFDVSRLRDAAVNVTGQYGWHVFPCRPGAKRPMVPDKWEQRSTADPDQVARYWPDDANIGIACGPSNLVVVDLDTHGELPPEWVRPGIVNGLDVFTQLLEWAGETHFPQTYWTVTPSGGWHFYFTAPDGNQIRNSTGRLGPMVDVRAAGGYVVGAGSVVDGCSYELVDDTSPATLPGWIAGELTRPPAVSTMPVPRGAPDRRLAGLVRFVEAAPESTRNSSLNWAAYQARELIAAGAEPDQLAAELIVAACTAGLPEAEARRTVASGMGMA